MNLLLQLFFSAAIAQQKDGWLTWTNGDNSISISYPKEWTEKKLNAGEIVAFVAPKTNEKDHYPDMLVLRAFPDSGIKDIDKLKNFARNTLNRDWNFKMISSQKLGTGEKQYIKSVAEDSKRNVVLAMYTLLKDDKIFFLTLNVEKRNYEKYKSAGQDAFDSLVINKAWIKE
jgi:hypothetical protein